MERLADHQGHFDLIITDLRMPILNGRSVLGAVKAALPEVPVIVMTAFGSPEIEAECLDKGAAAFLEKPLDAPQLLAAIERVFSLPNRTANGQVERRAYECANDCGAFRPKVGGGRDRRFMAARHRFNANGSFERKPRSGRPVQGRRFGKASGGSGSAIWNGFPVAVAPRGMNE